MAAVLVLASSTSGSAAEGPYPGLPRHGGVGGWAGVPQSGISEAARARQWARIPMQATAAYSNNVGTSFPVDDPLGRESLTTFTNYIYLVSPPGSEHNYGTSPKFTVQTVAFGAIPVEATLQLVQRRRDDGLPVPIVATADTIQLRSTPGDGGNRHIEGDTIIEDVVTLRVTRLVVDAVDLDLGPVCQTSKPGKLSLFGKGWRRGLDGVETAAPWKTGNYAPASGGLLAGVVDVPSFDGCLTSQGEDISRLLTTAVSGPANAVRLNVGAALACNRPIPPATTGTGPPRPGETTLEAANCQPQFVAPELPLP